MNKRTQKTNASAPETSLNLGFEFEPQIDASRGEGRLFLDGQHRVVVAFRQLSLPESPNMTMKTVIKQGENMSHSQMFNVLLGVLCDLAPSFFYTKQTTLSDLVDKIVAARPDWFQDIATPKEFWEMLSHHDLPSRDYFTIESRWAWERNQENGHFSLRALLDFEDGDIAQKSQFAFETGQEIDTLQRSASDGRSGKNWRSDKDRNARIYEREATAAFRVELSCESDEKTRLDLETLEKLTQWQDADFCYCLLYVLRLLVPDQVLPADVTKIQWIDLDDVMEKIGWYPSKLNREKREEQRAKIWRYLAYGNYASVVGRRSSVYRDRTTGEPISTQISSPLWRIMDVEQPVQPELVDENKTAQIHIPRRARLALSKEWEPMLVSSELHQYLPMAEVVAAIPPMKVAGDWARSMALVLARLWRMNPRETLASGIWITRKELLTSYSSKTPVDELIKSNNPKRVIEYWRDALGLLVDCRFIAHTDEAKRTVEEMLKKHPKYGWQEPWLEEKVLIRSGSSLEEAMNGRAQALPSHKPKVLGPSAKTRKSKKRSISENLGE